MCVRGCMHARVCVCACVRECVYVCMSVRSYMTEVKIG